MLRPIVKSCGIKVSAIGPHECVNLRIDPHLSEQFNIAKRPIQFTCQDGLEINLIYQTVIKCHTQLIWPDDLKGRNAVDLVFHAVT